MNAIYGFSIILMIHRFGADHICGLGSDDFSSAHPYEEPAYAVYKLEDF